MESLKEKVTIISGGGLARAIAVVFAKYGAKLVLADNDMARAQTVVEDCKKAGLTSDDVFAVEVNNTKKDDIQNMFDKCIARFGRLDILVNNAGVGRLAPLPAKPPDVYDALLNANVKTQLSIAQLSVPYLKVTKGNIVNLATIVAEDPSSVCGVYGMTKAAVEMFTKTLALEMAEFGIRVNEVRPGVVHTSFYDGFGGGFSKNLQLLREAESAKHPMGRIANPEEVANAIAFLASDMASFITGNAIYVDGGRHCVGPGFAKRQKPQN
ncbi:3-oxoacyl-[acyl-carrier-protein] reductase FabG-like [Argopecten irradians]|uniref:3-oxoacyl-[acyl-carrier-protein] reductase FabG-like n=1 Tax=Argopecten irradians TaxID=31199 RepID=UPI003723ABEE